MKEIEVPATEWKRIKERLVRMGVDEALRRYTPPVKLTHGSECAIYLPNGAGNAE